MKKSERIIVGILIVVLLLALAGWLGTLHALAAELTPTPTRTMRPTLEPTSTPWPYTPTPNAYPAPYPGPAEASAAGVVEFSAKSVPGGTLYLVAVVALIAGLIVFFERRYWRK